MPQENQHASPELVALLKDSNSFAFNLLVAYLDTYGMEALQWTPETVEMEIREDFGVDLPPANFDKLMTAISLLTTNSFFVSLPTFIRDCVSLNGISTPQDSMILPDGADIAWGITEALLICPPEDDEHDPFSEEIVAFIGETLSEEGILTPPDVLRIATRDSKLIDRVNYEFSDDPEMFAAIQSAESAKTDAINQPVRSHSHALLVQLRAMPLRNGKTTFAARMIAKLTSST